MTNKIDLRQEAASIAFSLSDTKIRALAMQLSLETQANAFYPNLNNSYKLVMIIKQGGPLSTSTTEVESIADSFLAAKKEEFTDALEDAAEEHSARIQLPPVVSFPVHMSDIDPFISDGKYAQDPDNVEDVMNIHKIAFVTAFKVLGRFSAVYSTLSKDVDELKQWYIKAHGAVM
jgi:hypothetical protein